MREKFYVYSSKMLSFSEFRKQIADMLVTQGRDCSFKNISGYSLQQGDTFLNVISADVTPKTTDTLNLEFSEIEAVKTWKNALAVMRKYHGEYHISKTDSDRDNLIDYIRAFYARTSKQEFNSMDVTCTIASIFAHAIEHWDKYVIISVLSDFYAVECD